MGIRASVIIAVGLALLAGAAETPAYASTYDCGTFGNYFAGRIYNPSGSQPYGARADIERTQSPQFCGSSSNPNASSAWSMLAGDAYCDGWAQIGYVYKTYGSVFDRFFTQWTKKNAGVTSCTTVQPTTIFWGDPTKGQVYTFQVGRDSTDHLLHMDKDGTLEDKTDFDPNTAWSGNQGQWFEEAWARGDDVFGTDTARTDYTNVESKDSSGNWNNQNWTGSGSGLCYYHVHEITSNSHFEVWTAPLDHSC